MHSNKLFFVIYINKRRVVKSQDEFNRIDKLFVNRLRFKV